MLNIFPSLLSLSFFSPLVLRIVLGVVMIWFSFEIAQKAKGAGKSTSPFVFIYIPVFSSLFIGLLMIAGSWTQIVALFSIFYNVVALINEAMKNGRIDRMIINVLLIAISISIITTGAGAFAFDLPL